MTLLSLRDSWRAGSKGCALFILVQPQDLLGACQMLGPELLLCVELNPEEIQQIIALKYELSPQALMNHITEKPETFPTQKSTCHPCRIIADSFPCCPPSSLPATEHLSSARLDVRPAQLCHEGFAHCREESKKKASRQQIFTAPKLHLAGFQCE